MLFSHVRYKFYKKYNYKIRHENTEWYDCSVRDVLFKFQTTEGGAAKTKYGTDSFDDDESI